MREHARKGEKPLRLTCDGREYHILHTSPPPYTRDCGVCPRCDVCRKHDKCNQTKGKLRNWKEFRKNQWKEKK